MSITVKCWNSCKMTEPSASAESADSPHVQVNRNPIKSA